MNHNRNQTAPPHDHPEEKQSQWGSTGWECDEGDDVGDDEHDDGGDDYVLTMMRMMRG